MKLVRWSAWLGPLFAVVACADAPSGSGSGAVGGDASGSSSTGPGDPPVVIDIGQDVLLLREGESVVLTVVVFDPDDDVVSGELFGPGEPSLYGELSSHPNGRWRASVGWDEVDAHASLELDRELELPFTVRFVDAEGHVAEAETSVRAVCGGLTTVACAGVCIDAQSDPLHCGGCDQPCTVGAALEGQDVNGGCMGGDCQPWWGGCFVPEPGSTCTSQCAQEGARCAAQACGAQTVVRYDLDGECEQGQQGVLEPLDCDEALGSGVALRCCCG